MGTEGKERCCRSGWGSSVGEPSSLPTSNGSSINISLSLSHLSSNSTIIFVVLSLFTKASGVITSSLILVSSPPHPPILASFFFTHFPCTCRGQTDCFKVKLKREDFFFKFLIQYMLQFLHPIHCISQTNCLSLEFISMNSVRRNRFSPLKPTCSSFIWFYPCTDHVNFFR